MVMFEMAGMLTQAPMSLLCHSIDRPLQPPAAHCPSLLQLTAVNGENEQLWNAMLHIHASLRAAHAAHLRQQVAMHAAAVAAVLPPPQAVVEEVAAPSPATLFGGLFSPGALGVGLSLTAVASLAGRLGRPSLLPLSSLAYMCPIVTAGGLAVTSLSSVAFPLLLPQMASMPTSWRPPAACSSRLPRPRAPLLRPTSHASCLRKRRLALCRPARWRTFLQTCSRPSGCRLLESRTCAGAARLQPLVGHMLGAALAPAVPCSIPVVYLQTRAAAGIAAHPFALDRVRHCTDACILSRRRSSC